MSTATTPWKAAGMTRSQWLLKHRGHLNMVIQALGDSRVPTMSPAEIVAHVISYAVPGPAGVTAAALRQSAAYHRANDHEDIAARLETAAALAEGQETPA